MGFSNEVASGSTYTVWTDVFDIDLSALGNQSFNGPDATGISFANASTWISFNTANCTTVMQNIFGSGLQINPVAATNIAAPRTAPCMGSTIAGYYPAFNYLTDSLRFWTHVSSFNGSVNFDFAYSGFCSHTIPASDNFVIATMRGFFGGASLRLRELFNGTVTDSALAQNLVASNNVMCCELTPTACRYLYGQINGDGTFPAISAMNFASAIYFSGAVAWNTPFVPPASNDFCFILGALRAASATNLIVQFKRMKLQIGIER